MKSPLAFLGLAGMAGMLFWLGHARPPGLKVPSVIAYLLSFVLMMAALAVVAKQRGWTSANHGFAAAILLGFAITGASIALQRASTPVCAVRYGRASGDLTKQLMESSGGACRAIFGLGAILSLLMAGWAASLWWRTRNSART